MSSTFHSIQFNNAGEEIAHGAGSNIAPADTPAITYRDTDNTRMSIGGAIHDAEERIRAERQAEIDNLSARARRAADFANKCLDADGNIRPGMERDFENRKRQAEAYEMEAYYAHEQGARTLAAGPQEADPTADLQAELREQEKARADAYAAEVARRARGRS